VRNHDCDDPDGLVFNGVTESGRYVEHNRTFLEADLQVYQGNVSAQAWKGYTGTGVVIGLASTRSIASHHSFATVPDPEKKKEHRKAAGTKLPGMKPEMTAVLEKATGKKTFYVNAVSGMGGRPIGIFAGHAGEVTPPAWELAGRSFTRAVPQADVLVVGLGAAYSYGSSENALIAAVGALVPPRYSPEQPVLREGGVVIALSPTTGWIDPDRYPSYQRLIDVYDRHHDIRDLVDYEETFHGDPVLMQKYRHGFGYPALHAFWIFYEFEYALKRAGGVIRAGTRSPGVSRKLGLQTAPDFDPAGKAARRYVGRRRSPCVSHLPDSDRPLRQPPVFDRIRLGALPEAASHGDPAIEARSRWRGFNLRWCWLADAAVRGSRPAPRRIQADAARMDASTADCNSGAHHASPDAPDANGARHRQRQARYPLALSFNWVIATPRPAAQSG
jgi:hypothetical protein